MSKITVHIVQDSVAEINQLIVLHGTETIVTLNLSDDNFYEWDYPGGDSDFGHWYLNTLDEDANEDV